MEEFNNGTSDASSRVREIPQADNRTEFEKLHAFLSSNSIAEENLRQMADRARGEGRHADADALVAEADKLGTMISTMTPMAYEMQEREIAAKLLDPDKYPRQLR